MEKIFREGFPYFFPALFVGIWLAVTLVLSRLGGWHRLSSQYRTTGAFPGKWWRFQSGRFHWAGYNNCLSVGANERGLYLSPLLFFCFGHPPPFIPWSEIKEDRNKFLTWTYSDLRFSEVQGMCRRISGRLWNRIDPNRPPGEEGESQISLPPKIEPE